MCLFLYLCGRKTRRQQQQQITEPQPPQNLLHGLVRSWAWPAVAARCASDPHEAQKLDVNHNSVLHLALMGGNPPVATVRAMVEAHSSILQITNADGLRPLNIACSYRVDHEVLEYLIEQYPQAANIAVTVENIYPFEQLLRNNRGSHALESILRVTHKRVFDGWDATSFLEMEYLEHSLNRRRLYGTRSQQREHEQSRQQRQRNEEWEERADLLLDLIQQLEEQVRESEFWIKAKLLMYCQYLCPEKEDGDMVLEGDINNRVVLLACVLDRRCPQSLKDYAFLLYVSLLDQQDDLGKTPLHYAVENNVDVTIYLESCPRAAQIPDNEGKLPLHYAAVSGTGIQTLLYYYREGAKTEDNLNKIPFDYVQHSVPDLVSLMEANLLVVDIHAKHLYRILSLLSRKALYELLRSHPEILAKAVQKTETNGVAPHRPR